ncbi:MAG: hypothetical protein K6B70_04740 [Clostridia bacterium]|nr:hypothetical protein [Clostridia bacterium]
MKKTKIMFSIVIIAAMIIALVPLTAFKSYATGTVRLRLDNVISVSNGENNTKVLKCSDNNDMVTVSATGNTFTIDSVNDTVNGQQVTNYFLEVEVNSQVTFTFSSSNASIVIGGGRENLDGNNSYTYTPTEDKNISLEFNQAGPGPIVGGQVVVDFDNATIANNGTITFDVEGTNVPVTVNGLDGSFAFNNNKLEIRKDSLGSIVFTLGNTFNRNNMFVYVMDKGTQKRLTVNGDSQVNFNDIDLTDDYPHFGINIDHSNNPNQVEKPENHPDNFDGKAYFVWIDQNNKVCYHKFTELSGAIPSNGSMRYIMNYINASDLTDESGNNSNFVWGTEFANWVLAKDLEDENGNIIPERLNKLYIFGDGIPSEDRKKEMGVQLDPCGGEEGANSLCSNADRNFRVTIYREEGYQAISFSDLKDDYTYFPGFWDPTFFSATVDISGTSKSKPAVYNTYLLEPTVKFTKGQFSADITAVEALDVNPNAVSITKVDGVFTVKFNSNYYDHVVFKVTAGGKDYFVQLNRIITDVHDNFGPGVTDTKIIAELYYPSTKSYNDFEVIATVVNGDGTEETSVVSVNKYESEDYQNVIANRVNDYVQNGGKGLYCSQYSIPVNREKAVGVYFTVINKGALSGDNYGGTYAGSGRGTYYDIESRNIVL